MFFFYKIHIYYEKQHKGKKRILTYNYGIQAIKKGINYYVFYNSKNKSIGEKHNKFSYSLIIYKEKANELLYVMISLII